MSEQLSEEVRGQEQPPIRAQVIFWFSVVSWIGLCVLTTLLVPLLTAMQPSLEAGLCISILVPGLLLLAANVAAIYPAFIARSLRRRTLIAIAWVLSVIVAALGDVAFLWGIIRLLIFGPSFR